MSAPVFAPEHKGLYISASGILNRAENNKGLRFMRSELHRHLEKLAERYYAGDDTVVDRFLQLYRLGTQHREAALAKAKEVAR